MSQLISTTLTAHFAQAPDPRLDWTKDHQLLDILVIVIYVIVCGGNAWVGAGLYQR